MTLIVASLPVRTLTDLEKIGNYLDADFIELRLDYSNKLPPVELFEKYKDKIIVTIRDIREGGINYIPPEEKIRYLEKLRERGIIYDVEARFAKEYNIPVDNEIVSTHYFDKVPSYEEVISLVKDFLDRAWIIKVAVIGKGNYKELLAKLLELGKVAVMPMGVNPLERIAFSLLGSKLMYCHTGEATAKGQIYYKDARKILDYLASISISSPTILTG